MVNRLVYEEKPGSARKSENLRIRHHISDFIRRNKVVTLSVVETAFDRLGEMLSELVQTLVRTYPAPTLSFGEWRERDCDAAIFHGSTILQISSVPAGITEFVGEATNLSYGKDDVSTIAQTTKHQSLREEGRQGTAGF